MKSLSLQILCLLFPVLVGAQEAHHHHHEEEELKAEKASAGSLYQLESEWIDRNGKSMKLSALQGQPRLIAMLYTRCQTACPLLVDDIQSILKQLPKEMRKMPVTLFSFDSDHESPATMSEFFKKRKLGDNWSLLKAKSGDVAELAAALGVRYKKLKNDEYIHSNVVFLLDAKGNIVAQREGLNTSSAEFVKAIRSNNKKPQP